MDKKPPHNPEPTSFANELARDATIDAGRYFERPAEVLTDPSLTLEQKRAVLESWRQDAVRLAESDDENMGGGEQAPLEAINNALLLLKQQESLSSASPADTQPGSQ